MVGGSSMIGFPLVIAVSERDMPGIKPGQLGWHTSALTNELQEVRLDLANEVQFDFGWFLLVPVTLLLIFY